MTTQIKFQVRCTCGWKTMDKKTLKEAQSALERHKHTVEIIKWVKVGVGSFDGEVVQTA